MNITDHITLNDLSIEFVLKLGYSYHKEFLNTKDEEKIEEYRLYIINICKELIKRKYREKTQISTNQYNIISEFLHYVLI